MAIVSSSPRRACRAIIPAVVVTLPLSSVCAAQAPATPCADCGHVSAAANRRYEEAIARLQHRLEGLRRRADLVHPSDTGGERDEREALAHEAETLAQALAEMGAAAGGDTGQAAPIAELSRRARLQAAHQRLWTLRARGSGRERQEFVRAPHGWFGLAISGESRRLGGPDTRVYYYDYPVVETVEPGSPAAAAGLERGDTILAYNGSDLRRREVALGPLLRPGATVAVRVRRGGTEREVSVLVARRPHAYAPEPSLRIDPLEDIRGDAERIAADLSREIRTLPGEQVPAGRGWPPHPPPIPRAWDPATMPLMPALPFLPGGALGDMAVAGAVVVPLNPDLREAFGVPRGVLVVDVSGTTPAEQAGLRGGDVIVRAGGETVTRALDLQRALRQASDRACDLEVVRKGVRRKVTLRW